MKAGVSLLVTWKCTSRAQRLYNILAFIDISFHGTIRKNNVINKLVHFMTMTLATLLSRDTV
jgi:hypothetical protein